MNNGEVNHYGGEEMGKGCCAFFFVWYIVIPVGAMIYFIFSLNGSDGERRARQHKKTAIKLEKAKKEDEDED